MKFRLNKKILLIALCSCVLVIGIGFATLSSVLNINPSANVTPNSNTFSVVFTNTSGTVDDNTPVVPNNSSNLMTSTNGSINNGGTNGPELSGLSTNFISPGQTVTYSLYVYNNGEYDAYLTDLIYNNVTGESSSKICSPGTDSNNIQTNSEYVASACNGISITVSVGGTVIEPGTLSTLHRLRKGESEAVVVTIEYALGSQVADGPFTVSFGSIELNYSTVMTISGGSSNPGTQDTPPTPVVQTKNLSESVSLGDYIKMTPTINTNTDITIAGGAKTCTLNPSLIDTWRVIRINNDGSIDAVSEYMTEYCFKNYIENGNAFYKSYVGDLNNIAALYTNDTYTQGSRHMGYNDQTEFITGNLYTINSATSVTVYSGTTSTPTSDNLKSSTESKGGGDTMHMTDVDLVRNALGTLCSKKIPSLNYTNDEQIYQGYLISGRKYEVSTQNNKKSYKWSIRIMTYAAGSCSNGYTAGTVQLQYLYYKSGTGYNKYIENGTVAMGSSKITSFRPIIVLKPNLEVNEDQDGSSSNPYILE